MDLTAVVWIVSGSVITILLGIIGFFLSSLYKTIKTLESTVNNLVTFMEVEKMQLTMNKENCKTVHAGIDRKFDNHEKRIQTLESK